MADPDSIDVDDSFADAMGETTEEKLARLEASVVATKRWVARREKACDQARGYLEANPSAYTTEQVQLKNDEFEQQVERVASLYKRIELLAGPGSRKGKDAVARMEELYGAADKVMALNMRALRNAADVQPAAGPARRRDPDHQEQQPKRVQAELKPETLTREATPEEYRVWKERWAAFYEASSLQERSITTQHHFLYAVLDSRLALAIKPMIGPTTPIFKERDGRLDSCIGALDEEFERQYPLQVMRFEFFKYRQSSGQSSTEFITKLQAKGEGIDLAALTVDQIYVFRIITGVRDDELRKEFLRMENPTTRDLIKKAREHESIQMFKEKISGTAQAAVMNSGQKPSDSKKKTKKSGKIKCFVCGQMGHGRSSCRKKKNARCESCGKNGHLEAACTGTTTKGHNSRAQSRSSSRRPSRSPSPESRSPSPRPSRVKVLREVPSELPCARKTKAKRFTSVEKATPMLRVKLKQGTRVAECDALPDTGTTRTVISLETVRKLGLEWLESDNFELKTATAAEVDVRGTCDFSAYTSGGETSISALVAKDVTDELLVSWHDLIRLGVIPKSFPEPIVVAVKNRIQKLECERAVTLDELKEEFSDVLSDQLPEGKCLKGEPMVIQLNPEKKVKPMHVTVARQVPLHYRKEAEELVQQLLDRGHIEKVDHPTEWITPGFFVPKEGGKAGVRLVTAFMKLNEAIVRPVHPFPSTKDILQQLQPDAKWFCKMDAVQGYFQVPLYEDSRDLTTFILPSGKYRYCVAPMGLKSSNDEYCRRTDPAVYGLDYASKIVDDILVQAPTEEELRVRVRTVLERCRDLNMTISLRKFKIGQEVKFAGHVISAEGVKPDKEKIKALSDFPVPQNITDLRSFIGLANQLGSFVPDLTQMIPGMRELLKKGVIFNWLEDHQKEFENVKRLLTSEMLVKPFDTRLPTRLLTDASRLKGLGYMLLQHDEDGKPRVIKCGSCSLTSAQRRYATIELECLAVTWAVKQCAFYLEGIDHFEVVTDHKPLVGIFKKQLDEIGSERLQRLRLKVLRFSFSVSWEAGKVHQIADALSRAPVLEGQSDETEDVAVARVVRGNLSLRKLEKDEAYMKICAAVETGLKLKDLAKMQGHPALAFKGVWDELSVEDGFVFCGDRLVVPQPARKEILRLLHLPHQGLTKTRESAKQLYFWPGMSSDIKNTVDSCEACQNLKPSLPSLPVAETAKSTVPMEAVGTDLFDLDGQKWLLLVDRFSGFVMAEKLRSENTGAVVRQLEKWFSEWGWPSSIRSDGGPQFRTEFGEWCRKNAISHEKCSPYNPRSNGLAEAAVKNVKYLLKKTLKRKEDFRSALLEWRNCPRKDGISPAQMFFGRRQRTKLPQGSRDSVSDSLTVGEMSEKRDTERQKQRAAHNRGATSVAELLAGDRVWIQDPGTKKWCQQGTISGILPTGSFNITLPDGKNIRRNRLFLRKKMPSEQDLPSDLDKNEKVDENREPSKKPTYAEVLRRSPRLAAQKRRVKFDHSWEDASLSMKKLRKQFAKQI